MNFSKKWFYVALFIVLFLLTRLPMLGPDIINPDAVNWHYRSEQFVVGLKTGDWEKTYQHYHPGVTLMWIMGPVVEIVKQVDSRFALYDKDTFLVFHTISKYTLVLIQLVLTLTVLFFLSKVTTFLKAFLITLLFSLEPFFLGNSRLLHLDVLMTLFLFNGLVLVYWVAANSGNSDKSVNAYKPLYKVLLSVLAGVFLSLAFLTKSVALGGIIFALLFLIIKRLPKLSLVMAGTFVITTFILFPALWVRPVYVLGEIFREGERVGVRKGHEQILMGETTMDAGPGFYPLVLLMKVSPVVWVGVLIYAFFLISNLPKLVKELRNNPTNISLPLFLSIFYLGYILVMTFPAKKIDRYIIPMFPYLALLAYLGYEKLSKLTKSAKSRYFVVMAISAMVGIFILFPLITYYPYYFTYTSPILGTAKNANNIVAQKPFGVGIPSLKGFIFEKYGEYPELGFFDVKPMRSIYMSSRICDIRVCGTSDYNLLVLGINEEIPSKVFESGAKFTHDASYFINGLEYWRIFVKNASAN